MSDLLKAVGWSKSEFAKRMGVSPRTVYQWCKTEPEYAMKYLRLVAKLLDV